MRKIDIIIAVVVGEMVAWYFVAVFRSLAPRIIWGLPIVFPVLSGVCLYVAYLIGKKFLFVFQGAKFLLMGTLSALIDLGILNILIWVSGIASGIAFPFFKGLSFIIATCNRYLGNKFWTFGQKEAFGLGKEFVKFFLVTLGGLIINVTTASLMVNIVGPQFGLSETIWANIGAVTGSLATIIWNFTGYKFFVFKK